MLLIIPIALLMLVAWNVICWPAVSNRKEPEVERNVSVLIPARNEESTLAACLQSIVGQPGVAEILVYDDHSTDATASVVQLWAAKDPRIRLAVDAPLPAGWCGKTFACARLAAQSRSQWLLFLDADARLTSNAVARLTAEARRRNITFLSAWPAFRMIGFQEQLLMPLLNFSVFTLFPAPLALSRRDPSLGLAHGACILVERSAYERVGGHTAVASEIFEDTRLARVWRERGEMSLCLDGQQIVEVRMYNSLAGIWSGFQKNFFPAFRTRQMFWAFLLLHTALFLIPFLIGSPAALAVIAMRLLLAIRFRHPLWSVLLHPVAECFLIALGISSWWECRTGRGVAWKGRRYLHS